jgi:hypothetical protein
LHEPQEFTQQRTRYVAGIRWPSTLYVWPCLCLFISMPFLIVKLQELKNKVRHRDKEAEARLKINYLVIFSFVVDSPGDTRPTARLK